MDDKGLVPRESSGLVKRTEGLAKRGLELLDRLQQTEVFLSEAEISPFIDSVDVLMENIGDPPKAFLERLTANPHDIPSFDINSFFQVFDRIKLREGYVLDYVYNYDGEGGEPLIYARENNTPPLLSPIDYYKRFILPKPATLSGREPTYEDSLPCLAYLEFEATPLGYFQFAIFYMKMRRFYLFGRSKRYNARQYFLTQTDLDRFSLEHRKTVDNLSASFPGQTLGDVKKTPKGMEFLLSAGALIGVYEIRKYQKITPRLLIRGDAAQVTIISYEKFEKDFSKLHLNLRHPNVVESVTDEPIELTGEL